MKSRYIGNVYDGRWEVKERNGKTFVLENIYNHEIMELDATVMGNVDKGKTTISNVRTCRIYHLKRDETPKAIKRQIFKVNRRLGK